MNGREQKPPQWGPVTDPSPWPWPPWDPIPWIWRHVPFPDGDPIPFPARILEKIQTKDLIALKQANLEAINHVFQAQLEAQKVLLNKQQEILGNYE